MHEEFPGFVPFKREPEPPETSTKAQEEWHPIADLHREMDQLMSRFFGKEGSAYPPESHGRSSLNKWFGDFSPRTFSPSIDIADEPNHFKVIADMPGIDTDDIELDVHDHRLFIRGEKKIEESTEEHDGYYRTERAYGSFERVIPLPDKVDAEHAEAVFKNGVLSVRIPKASAPKEEPTIIKVNAK